MKLTAKEPQEYHVEGWVDDEEDYKRYEYTIKWDGCIHLHIRHIMENEAGQFEETPGASEPDYIHLCSGAQSIDKLIEALQVIKAEGLKTGFDYWGVKP